MTEVRGGGSSMEGVEDKVGLQEVELGELENVVRGVEEQEDEVPHLPHYQELTCQSDLIRSASQCGSLLPF